MSSKIEKTEKKEAVPHHAGPSDMDGLKTLKQYMVPVCAGVLVALVVVIGIGIYKSSKVAKAEQAANALMQAQTLEEVQQVATEYEKTATGPAAMLALANAYFQSGQYLLAKSSYNEFLKAYPAHILAPAAVLGQAFCQEAEGDVAGALQAFQAFVAANPDYFLTPTAVFGQARCLEELKQYDEAKVVLEDFIVQYPSSRWLENARTTILYIERAQRADGKGLTVSSPVVMDALPLPMAEEIPVVEAEVVEVGSPE